MGPIRAPAKTVGCPNEAHAGSPAGLYEPRSRRAPAAGRCEADGSGECGEEVIEESPAAVSLPSRELADDVVTTLVLALVPPPASSVRDSRLLEALKSLVVDEKILRELTWTGISPETPPVCRAMAWEVIIGYLPPNASSRASFLKKKRAEYWSLVDLHYRHALDSHFARQRSQDALRSAVCPSPSASVQNLQAVGGHQAEGLSDALLSLRQIRLDLKRTHPPGYPLFQSPECREMMERILTVIAALHPDVGYVQGQNDILSIFVIVLLWGIVPDFPETEALATCPWSRRWAVEADLFFCFSKTILALKDIYVPSQPGIMSMSTRLKDLIRKVDSVLYAHLAGNGVDLFQVTFRWFNCILCRELPLDCSLRLWDTYIAEGITSIVHFHVYVCAAFLLLWSDTLKQLNDFQSLMLYIQDLPTDRWGCREIQSLLSEAFILKSLYHDSESHWTRSSDACQAPAVPGTGL